MKHGLFFWVLFFLLAPCVQAQNSDSSIEHVSGKDSILPRSLKTVRPFENILKENIFLNSQSDPVPVLQQPRKYISKNAVFYFLAFILLMLGILKVTYSRYFNNLVRVFFNTSLRQSQLTDQLLQARLPSMFFNLFFIIISGCYTYLLLNYFEKIPYHNWNVLLLCTTTVLIIYLVKFCTLKFAGWLTGHEHEAEMYIFIVFLVNKILALCMIPVVVIIAFSGIELVKITVLISFTLIAISLVLRFFRAYGLLQARLKVSTFHFLLYAVGMEILPLLVIYKAFIVIMSKNL